jgi:predicted nucleic acid-binding Zn ribbon protein
MPIYRFRDTETDEIFEVSMKINEKFDFLSANPQYESVIQAPSIVSGVSVTGKVPDGFKEVLSRISEQHSNTELADRYGKKSIKEVRTNEVVRRHVDKVTKRLT